jgi:uncharacterized membrane protein (DUF485 family)
VTALTLTRGVGRRSPDPDQEAAPVTESEERRLLTPEEYREAQSSPEFVELKKRFRAFAVPMTVAFLVWYLLFVVLSTYAHDFMSTRVFGNINIGLLFGLLQFVSTFVITHLYVSHANRKTDPIADEMRERLEQHQYAAGAGTADGGAGATRV